MRGQLERGLDGVVRGHVAERVGRDRALVDAVHLDLRRHVRQLGLLDRRQRELSPPAVHVGQDIGSRQLRNGQLNFAVRFQPQRGEAHAVTRFVFPARRRLPGDGLTRLIREMKRVEHAVEFHLVVRHHRFRPLQLQDPHLFAVRNQCGQHPFLDLLHGLRFGRIVRADFVLSTAKQSRRRQAEKQNQHQKTIHSHATFALRRGKPHARFLYYDFDAALVRGGNPLDQDEAKASHARTNWKKPKKAAQQLSLHGSLWQSRHVSARTKCEP